ncbi:hypothetical protein M1N78_03165 [Peptococcaceae bacterium]|nr:hypothetical protein [Peptococcaceae bacterium]
MRIIFIGTVEFSKRALNKLIELNANVVGVCTKEKSQFHSDYASLEGVCKSHNIDYKFCN